MRCLRLVLLASLLLVTGLAVSCSKQDGKMKNSPRREVLEAGPVADKPKAPVGVPNDGQGTGLEEGDVATKPEPGQSETPRLPPARP